MLSVRSLLGYPQSKVAAILAIADKSRKNDELKTRELLLSKEVKIFEEFDKNLVWLIHGASVHDSEQSARLAGKSAKAVFEHADANDKSFSSAAIQNFTQYIFEQSLSKGTSPRSETMLFFLAFG